jgi:hypothetical protein
MKSCLFILALSFTSLTFAKDSLWLVCKSDNLVVNVLEHRSGAENRAMALSLIHGAHVATGSSDYESTNAVVLGGPNMSFLGQVDVDFAKSTLELKGSLSLSGFAKKITQKLDCSEMSNLKDL